MPGEQQFYSEDEAHELLHLASQQSISSGMSRDELLRAAMEMGISPEAIQRAEEELQRKREQDIQQEREKELRKEFEKYNRSKFMGNVGSYLSTCTILVAIWFITGRHYFWPGWVIFFWGLSVVPEFFTHFLNTAKKERRYQRWLARRGAPPSGLEGKIVLANKMDVSIDGSVIRIQKRGDSTSAVDELMEEFLEEGGEGLHDAIKFYREKMHVSHDEARRAVKDYNRRHPGAIED